MDEHSRAEAFCRTLMAELEEQWTRARGHQERHPLREKMRQIGAIVERVRSGETLDAILTSGISVDDAMRCLVCEELLPRWEQMRGPASTSV